MGNGALFILGMLTIFIPFFLYMTWRGYIETDFSKGIHIRYTQRYKDLIDEVRREVEDEERRAEWHKRYKK